MDEEFISLVFKDIEPGITHKGPLRFISIADPTFQRRRNWVIFILARST